MCCDLANVRSPAASQAAYQLSASPPLTRATACSASLLSPPAGQREFVRRQLLISTDVLEYRAQRAQREQIGTPLGHGVRVLARNLLAMPRLLRGAR